VNKITYFTLQKNIRDSIPETQRANFDLQFMAREKNVTIALVLSLFLGTFGIDRFYLGQLGLGVLKLFTLGCFGIWTVIDWFRIMGIARSKNIEIATHLQQTPLGAFPIKNSSNGIKTFFIWFGIFIVVMMLVGGIFGGKEGKNRVAASSDSTSTAKGYTLQALELTMLDAVLQDEAKTFGNAGDSMLGRQENLQPISAAEITQQYDNNQVAADQKYFEKKIFLKGVVSSINSGLGNEPYITLQSKHYFSDLHVDFKEANVEKISAIKRGEQLFLVCMGNGAIIGTPMFKNCQFADDYAAKRIAEEKTEILEYLHGKEPASEFSEKVALFSIAMARALPATAACATDSSKCISEMRALPKKGNKEKIFLPVLKELKANGVQVSAKLESSLQSN